MGNHLKYSGRQETLEETKDARNNSLRPFRKAGRRGHFGLLFLEVHTIGKIYTLQLVQKGRF